MTDMNRENLPTPDPATDGIIEQTVITETATPESGHAPEHAAPKKTGARTFLYGFAGAAVACILAFGVGGAVTTLHAADVNSGNAATGVVDTGTDGNGGTASITVNGEDTTLPEAIASKCLPSVAFVATYVDTSSMSNGYGYGGGNDYGYGWGFPYGYGYGDDYGDGYGYGYGYGQQNSFQMANRQVVDDNLTEYGTGSGVVLSEDGYILTNNHVVEGGAAWTVTIEGKTYDCDLVGTDPTSDVAVLKAKDASGLTPMEIGDSNELIVGEWVMTIGSPFGLEQSVATGIVSATNRSQIVTGAESGSDTDTIYPNMIQTDAAINPGNSGGAMVDAQGKLIGINTLITSYSGNYSGVGFAIPVNYAMGIADKLIAGEEPTYAQLGVSLSDITSAVAQNYGLSSDTGAYVAEVVPDSAAAQAGIVKGDIITGFNGKEVASSSDLMLDVRGEQPGTEVTLTVVKADGQTQDVKVTLGESSPEAAQQQEQGQQMPQMPRQR